MRYCNSRSVPLPSLLTFRKINPNCVIMLCICRRLGGIYRHTYNLNFFYPELLNFIGKYLQYDWGRFSGRGEYFIGNIAEEGGGGGGGGRHMFRDGGRFAVHRLYTLRA